MKEWKGKNLSSSLIFGEPTGISKKTTHDFYFLRLFPKKPHYEYENISH